MGIRDWDWDWADPFPPAYVHTWAQLHNGKGNANANAVFVYFPFYFYSPLFVFNESYCGCYLWHSPRGLINANEEAQSAQNQEQA